jgi:hypothetical protein
MDEPAGQHRRRGGGRAARGVAALISEPKGRGGPYGRGFASNWIAEHVRAGSVLDLLPPAGTFSPRSLDGDFAPCRATAGDRTDRTQGALDSARHLRDVHHARDAADADDPE